MADPASVTLGIGFDVSPQEVSNLQRRLAALERDLNLRISVTGGGDFVNINKDVSQFTSYLDRANQRVIAFTSSVSVLYTTIKVFKDIVNSTIEVDKALVDINSVMRLSTSNLDQFSKKLFDVARETSTSFEHAAEAAKAFSRQGLGVEETLKRTRDALILSRITGDDVTESFKQLTEAAEIFQKTGINTKDIIHGLSLVSSNFAVSTKDITDAFTRVGSTASTAGVNFNQLVGLIAAAKQSTQRDGAAIGTALNSIFTRFEPQEAIKGLERLGIVIKDSAGNALPVIGILQNLAGSYDKLSDSSKSQIDKLIGGARQINILKGALGDLSNATGTYAQVQKLLSGNLDDATDRIKVQNESISSLLQNFITANKQIGSNIGQLSFAPILKTFVGTGNDNPITKALEDASGNAETTGGKFAEGILKGIGNSLIFGLAPILAVAGSKIIGRTYSTLFSDIKGQAFNDTANQQVTIQDKIVSLYNQGDEALQRQLATMTLIVNQGGALANSLSRGTTNFGGVPKSVAEFFPNGRSLRGGQLASAEDQIRQRTYARAGISTKSLNDIRNDETDALIKKNPFLAQALAGGGQTDILNLIEERAQAKYGDIQAQKLQVDPLVTSQVAALRKQNSQLVRQQIRRSEFNRISPVLESRGTGFSGIFGSKSGDIAALEESLGGKLNSDQRAVLPIPLAALQARRATNIQTAGVAASFILPFVGGALEQYASGPGGSARGIGVGGASGALNGAGLGAGLGLFLGPEGALFGALAGGVIGGIKGAFDKITKSLTEVAEEIANKNNKIKDDFTKATDAFTIAAQLTDAIKNGGGSRKIRELEGDLSASIGGIQDKNLKSLIIGNITSPNGQQKVIDYQNTVTRREDISDSFRTAGSRLLSGSSFSSGLGLSPFGGVGYTPNVDPAAQQGVASAVGRGISGLSEREIQTITRTNQNNPQAVFNFLAKRAGLSSSQISDFAPGILTDSTAYNKNLQGGISQALSQRSNTDITQALEKARNASVDFSDKLRTLSENFQFSAKASQIFLQAYEKVSEAFQKTVLYTSNLTQLSKLATQAGFDQASITTNFAGQRSQAINSSGASLTALLAKAGVNDTDILQRVATANSQSDFEGLLKSGSSNKSGIYDKTTNEEYLKILKDAVDKLREINISEAASLRVAQLTNQLLQVQEKTRERDVLREGARFNGSAFSEIQLQSSLGRTSRGSPYGRALQNDSLIKEQDLLSSLGIPQTDTSLSYVSALQKERTQSTLSQILSSRLRRKVGTSPSDLKSAANSLDGNVEGNDYLKDRILKAVDANQYDPQKEIETVRKSFGANPTEFAKSLSNANLGSTDSFLATGFNDITSAISGSGGTNDLLQSIREALVSQQYAKILNEKYDTLSKADINLSAARASGDSKKIETATSQYNSALGEINKPVIVDGSSVATGSSSATSAAASKVQSLAAINVKTKPVKSPSGNPFSGFGAGFSSVGNQDYFDSAYFQSFADVGKQVADSITGNFGRMWDSFATGSMKGKSAFREFLAGITGDASKAFASQGIKTLFGALFSSNGLMGSLFKYANGGAVPAVVTGGEFYVSPQAARNIGYDRLNAMNRGFAGGGMVNGGSGLKDDLPVNLAPGSFILKKSAVQRWGPSRLQSIANGAVSRAMGGPIGFDAGGTMPSFHTDPNTFSGATMYIGNSAGNNPNVNVNAGGAGIGGALESSGYGLLASLVLMLVEKFLQPSYHLLDSAGVGRNADSMRASQSAAIGSNAILKNDGNGNYSVLNYNGPSASSTNYSANGGMIGFEAGGPAAIVPVSGGGGGVNPNVGIHIVINNHGQNGTSSSTSTQATDASNSEFAKKMGTQVEAKVKEVLTNEMRNGGIFSQQRRYFPSTR